MASLSINGVAQDLDVDPNMPLLWALRDILGMTGTKFGCGLALCGACTVLMDGLPIRSCQTPVAIAAGKEVTTIEGLEGPVADAVREAWVGLDVPQCGYCQSGQVLAATVLLTDTPRPSDQQIDSALGPHICRCATYHRIRAAVHDAAERLEG